MATNASKRSSTGKSKAKTTKTASSGRSASGSRAKTSGSRPHAKRKQAVTPEQAKTRAEKILRDPKKVSRIADQAEAIASKKQTKGFKKVLGETKALIRLARAYARGEYRSVSFESMVLIVAALIYLVSPIDLIPDFLPGGLVDDAAVIAYTIALVRDEVEEFMDWEDSAGG